MQNKNHGTMKEKGLKKMLTIKMKADSLVFKDLTPTMKNEIIERCNLVSSANYSPFLTEPHGKDLTVLADHSDLYGLIYSLSFKYDIEIV